MCSAARCSPFLASPPRPHRAWHYSGSLIDPDASVLLLQCRTLQSGMWERDVAAVSAVNVASVGLVDLYLKEVRRLRREFSLDVGCR